MKCELDSYRKYCDHATELMIDVEETTPFATKMFMKGLPIFDRNLKRLIAEIQEKAKIVCNESKGTVTEEIACAVSREVQQWEVGSQEEMAFNLENLIFTLESKVPRIPINQDIFNRIQKIRVQKDVPKQLLMITSIILMIPQLSMDEKINNMKQGIEEIKTSIKVINEDARSMSQKLDEIQEMQKFVDKFIASIGELQNPQKYLDTIKQDFEAIKGYMPKIDGQINEILNKLNTPSSTTQQKLKIAIPIIPSIVTYNFETDVPRLVADKIKELKNLILNF